MSGPNLPRGATGASAFCLASLLAQALPALGGDLPQGFVRLSEVAPGIAQDMRYASADNFTGAVVPGYRAGVCILAAPVAVALAKVQSDLDGEGFRLVTYDCYRPARAVRAFVDWARGNQKTDPVYHPDAPASRLFAQGYIAARSGHSSGGSIDLGLLRREGEGWVPLDMGSGFDFFGARSHAGAKGIGAAAQANRKRLAEAMTRHGFAPYAREWWHFRYRAEPFEGRIFDFEVTGPSDIKEGETR
ncbi:M15 family metallopeptidase [Ancylobacter rudongensis]|uniref:D-alanyl-D-alanine dipeptidase n=1 Tax=Ancylobacter rudongensis TaxID=177413 RepID=A0A1G4SBA1_9HYPH|nr:M15 family metallopeptidase [Ancylobacter rudongensis]SCW66493.1 D-alanyl-D-alanine dipeptidase [Ancylobacter rudongensis]